MLPCAPAALYWVVMPRVTVAAVVHWICAPAGGGESAARAAGVDDAASDATRANATRRRFTKANPLHPGPGTITEPGTTILADREIRRFR